MHTYYIHELAATNRKTWWDNGFAQFIWTTQVTEASETKRYVFGVKWLGVQK